MSSTNQNLIMIGIAAAGVYGQYATVSYPNGTTSKSSLCTYDTKLERYYDRLVEGGIVIDKRTVDEYKLIEGVISGPMLDMDLAPGCVTKGFSRDAAPYTGEPLKSLDTVALDVYLGFWKPLGARVGYRKGDRIEWEDGGIDVVS